LNTQKQILLIVVLFFTFVGGCAAYTIIDLPLRAPDQQDWTHDQSVERGALLFANNCRTCHGIKGQGGVGLPLNKPEFKDQDPLVLVANQKLLQTTLYCGRLGTRMPAWLNVNGGSLNAEQVNHLIDLITEAADPNLKDDTGQPFLDDNGNPSSKGWLEAVGFAHNLNRETNALVGGDNLDGVAKQHNIGYGELAAANNVPIFGTLSQGSVLQIPASSGSPAYDYHVYNNNETITKVADSQHVGARIIADLNGLKYKFTESKGKSTLTLLAPDGTEVPGLTQNTTLKLPASTTYTVASGDTLDAIAAKHGLTASAIASLNAAILTAQKYSDTSKPLESNNRLNLPAGTGIVVQPGQTVGTIATSHGLKPEDLQTLNGLTAETVVGAGQKLKLPDSTRYTIQIGDTLALIASGHGIAVDALVNANDPKPSDPLSAEVVLKLPPVDKFQVKGQSLDDVAQAYSNVTADSLGQANSVPANVILLIGTKLNLPADSWGSTPANTLNNGTACVQHAVPNSVYANLLPGAATPAVTAPATLSTTVKVEAHADDYTVTADGTAQPLNKGVVAIATGKSITFTNVAGLHTITQNGTKQGDNFTQGQTRTLTFDKAGQYKITCDFHPDMLINIFVQ
jgi:LysM repeat protein/plastocyanin/mono/diheme cytochrome c family protein